MHLLQIAFLAIRMSRNITSLEFCFTSIETHIIVHQVTVKSCCLRRLFFFIYFMKIYIKNITILKTTWSQNTNIQYYYLCTEACVYVYNDACVYVCNDQTTLFTPVTSATLATSATQATPATPTISATPATPATPVTPATPASPATRATLTRYAGSAGYVRFACFSCEDNETTFNSV